MVARSPEALERKRAKNKEYQRVYVQENLETVRRRQRAYEAKRREENPAVFLFKRARDRAKKLGIPFNLTQADIFVPPLCPVFQEPMVLKTRTAPSLDRVRPELGYVKDNIQVMSTLANTMKADASPEQLRKFANWIINQNR